MHILCARPSARPDQFARKSVAADSCSPVEPCPPRSSCSDSLPPGSCSTASSCRVSALRPDWPHPAACRRIQRRFNLSQRNKVKTPSRHRPSGLPAEEPKGRSWVRRCDPRRYVCVPMRSSHRPLMPCTLSGKASIAGSPARADRPRPPHRMTRGSTAGSEAAHFGRGQRHLARRPFCTRGSDEGSADRSW